MIGLVRCPLCKARATQQWGCCQACYRALQLEPYRNSKNVMVLGEYTGMLKKAVQALKYRKITALATLLGTLLAEAIRDEAYRFNNPLPQAVCAVPLHWRRLLSRTYNQARLIAEASATSLERDYTPVLARARHTQSQVRLSGTERHNNVADAFALRRHKIDFQKRYILLVDDVVTTGATLKACAKILQETGFTVVMAAVAEA